MSSDLVDMTPAEAGIAAMQALAPMLHELGKALHWPESDPRRAAAIAEKRRVLALIERSKEAK